MFYGLVAFYGLVTYILVIAFSECLVQSLELLFIQERKNNNDAYTIYIHNAKYYLRIFPTCIFQISYDNMNLI